MTLAPVVPTRFPTYLCRCRHVIVDNGRVIRTHCIPTLSRLTGVVCVGAQKKHFRATGTMASQNTRCLCCQPYTSVSRFVTRLVVLQAMIGGSRERTCVASVLMLRFHVRVQKHTFTAVTRALDGLNYSMNMINADTHEQMCGIL